jgi:predicted nuclease of predicted toxin-antitoxin system
VPNSAILILQVAGHEVLRLKDHIPPNSPDTQVISKAQELDAILFSLNGDFADIVSYPPGKYKGIVTLQVKNHPEVFPQIMDTLTTYLSAHNDMKHYSGKLLVVESHIIRKR